MVYLCIGWLHNCTCHNLSYINRCALHQTLLLLVISSEKRLDQALLCVNVSLLIMADTELRNGVKEG
jgi:hypothetical protein